MKYSAYKRIRLLWHKMTTRDKSLLLTPNKKTRAQSKSTR